MEVEIQKVKFDEQSTQICSDNRLLNEAPRIMASPAEREDKDKGDGEKREGL